MVPYPVPTGISGSFAIDFNGKWRIRPMEYSNLKEEALLEVIDTNQL